MDSNHSSTWSDRRKKREHLIDDKELYLGGQILKANSFTVWRLGVEQELKSNLNNNKIESFELELQVEHQSFLL